MPELRMKLTGMTSIKNLYERRKGTSALQMVTVWDYLSGCDDAFDDGGGEATDLAPTHWDRCPTSDRPW